MTVFNQLCDQNCSLLNISHPEIKYNLFILKSGGNNMDGKRENTLQTCLSEEEREAVMRMAEDEGISVSAFIRRAVRRDIKKN